MAVTHEDVERNPLRAMSAKQLSSLLTLVDEHTRSHTNPAAQQALLRLGADVTRMWLEAWS